MYISDPRIERPLLSFEGNVAIILKTQEYRNCYIYTEANRIMFQGETLIA